MILPTDRHVGMMVPVGGSVISCPECATDIFFGLYSIHDIEDDVYTLRDYQRCHVCRCLVTEVTRH